jgi:hypothetical protein
MESSSQFGACVSLKASDTCRRKSLSSVSSADVSREAAN